MRHNEHAGQVHGIGISALLPRVSGRRRLARVHDPRHRRRHNRHRARLVRDLARNGGYWREPLKRVFPGQRPFLLVERIPALRSQRRGHAFRGRPVTVERQPGQCATAWGEPDDTLRANADRDLEHL